MMFYFRPIKRGTPTSAEISAEKTLIADLNAVPDVEIDWLTTLNSYRVSSGVNPVKESGRISKAAQAHADYLASTD